MLQQFQLHAHQRSNAVSLNVYMCIVCTVCMYNITYNNKIIQIHIRMYQLIHMYICKYVGMYVPVYADFIYVRYL